MNSKPKIKVAVIGSRTYTNKEELFSILDRNYDRIEMIISGGAAGSDSLAQEWAKERGFPCMVYYARWKDKEGNLDRGAGFKRNIDIIKDADKILAFWDGESKGTANSLSQAERLGKDIHIVKFVAPPKEIKKRGRKPKEETIDNIVEVKA